MRHQQVIFILSISLTEQLETKRKLPLTLLKKLIKKQQRDGVTEDTVIQRIKANPFVYDIVLFNQRSNLAIFCCADDRNFKSKLSWDVTFDLGKSPSYHFLALSYRNITFINKTTDKSNIMLGPVLVCHKNDEKATKLLCDTLLDIWPD